MGIFTGWGMPEIAAQILIGFLGVGVLITLLMVLDIFLVWVERKVVSRFQDRIGPNRVGPFGLIQPFADIIKLLIKEDITPGGADKVVYNIAPMLSMMSVLILWAMVPLAPTILGVDLNIGAVYMGAQLVHFLLWRAGHRIMSVDRRARQVAVMVSLKSMLPCC
jgi:NADH-quinone oxidoreductase subunit H